ncbi:MAG: GerW family sporulation protein [Lachnospiraceae bacterium]|nr:GerW family sporulation protein [Lachnospiraceae bacterium]
MEEKTLGKTIDELLKGMDGFLATKTVVGEPMEFSDGTIVLPLVDVSFGVGAGAFAGKSRDSAAGGLGGKMSPKAVLVIKDGHTKLVTVSQDSWSKLADSVPDFIDKIKTAKKDKKEMAEKAGEKLDEMKAAEEKNAK